MGDTKNLTGREAISKVQEMAQEIKTCMFGTYSNGKLITRPMSTQQVDENGNLWFLSDRNSIKNDQIATDNEVELIYGQSHDKFLALHGKASISYDKEKIKELWEPIAKIWMTGGVDDPRLSAIEVKFDDGYYWDVKHGKAVEAIKMATAFVTGKTMDDGIEGTLKREQ